MTLRLAQSAPACECAMQLHMSLRRRARSYRSSSSSFKYARISCGCIAIAADAHVASCSRSCLLHGGLFHFFRHVVRTPCTFVHQSPSASPHSQTASVEVLGGGNINDTFLVRSSNASGAEGTGTFVLQRINSGVFPNVSPPPLLINARCCALLVRARVT
jgi:hypothetical protein